MNKVKVWIFKESGKWYTEESIMIPKELSEVFQIVDYIRDNYESYKGMHLVIPFDEDFVINGYPCMIPSNTRRYK